MHRHEPDDYDCPFCRVVAGGESKVNSRGDVVLRAEGATAFVAPKWWERNPGHVLVAANRHVENVYGIEDDELADVYRTARAVATAIRETYGCDGTSMRQHNEPAGNQDVWHFHVHVFPRYEDDDLYRNLLRARWTTQNERAPYAARLRAYLNE
jgi:histidine triad (HIT) family protein